MDILIYIYIFQKNCQTLCLKISHRNCQNRSWRYRDKICQRNGRKICQKKCREKRFEKQWENMSREMSRYICHDMSRQVSENLSKYVSENLSEYMQVCISYLHTRVMWELVKRYVQIAENMSYYTVQNMAAVLIWMFLSGQGPSIFLEKALVHSTVKVQIHTFARNLELSLGTCAFFEPSRIIQASTPALSLHCCSTIFTHRRSFVHRWHFSPLQSPQNNELVCRSALL